MVSGALSILGRIMIWTVVLAAGSGSRYGAAKQFDQLGGRRIIDRSVDVASGVSDGVVLVVPAGETDPGHGPVGGSTSLPETDECVQGGATRSESVRAGLAAVPGGAEIIVVHDAARPLAGRAIFDRVVQAVLGGADAAIPGLVVVDTIKRVRDDTVVETIDRSELVAVQTPQAFAAGVLRRAHESGGDATDDASLVEAMGGTVVVVAGEPENMKITLPHDLRVAETWLR